MGLLDFIARRLSTRANLPTSTRTRRAGLELLEQRRLLSAGALESSFRERFEIGVTELYAGDWTAMRDSLRDGWEAPESPPAQDEPTTCPIPPEAPRQPPDTIEDILPVMRPGPSWEGGEGDNLPPVDPALRSPHPWTAVMDGELIVLYHEYEEFAGAGGDPADFTPSNPLIDVVDGRIMVDVAGVQRLARKEYNDSRNMIRVENSAFAEPFIEQLEGLGMQVTHVGYEAVRGWLPIDALDDLVEVPGIKYADAAVNSYRYSEYLGERYSRGRPMTEILDADLLELFREFWASRGQGGTHSRRVSVDVITVEPVSTEHIIDGYVVETTNRAFLWQLVDAGIHDYTIREFGISVNVMVCELDTLAGFAGVEAVVPAGHAGQGGEDDPEPPDERPGDKTPIRPPVCRPIPGPVEVIPPALLPEAPVGIRNPIVSPVTPPSRPVNGPAQRDPSLPPGVVDVPVCVPVAPRFPPVPEESVKADSGPREAVSVEAAAALYYLYYFREVGLAGTASSDGEDDGDDDALRVGLDLEAGWLLQGGRL